MRRLPDPFDPTSTEHIVPSYTQEEKAQIYRQCELARLSGRIDMWPREILISIQNLACLGLERVDVTVALQVHDLLPPKMDIPPQMWVYLTNNDVVARARLIIYQESLGSTFLHPARRIHLINEMMENLHSDAKNIRTELESGVSRIDKKNKGKSKRGGNYDDDDEEELDESYYEEGEDTKPMSEYRKESLMASYLTLSKHIVEYSRVIAGEQKNLESWFSPTPLGVDHTLTSVHQSANVTPKAIEEVSTDDDVAVASFRQHSMLEEILRGVKAKVTKGEIIPPSDTPVEQTPIVRPLNRRQRGKVNE